MKLKFIALLGFLTVSLGGVALNSIYNSDKISAESNRHVFYVKSKSGEVTLDSKGNIISASSPELLSNNQGISINTVENNAYGRWVYFKDGFFTHTGHSNFYSSLGKHFSWVSMGDKSKTYAYASSGKYSEASQKGDGTFHAGYGLK